MNPKLPLSVQKLLDQSAVLLQSEQTKQAQEKQSRLNVAQVAYSKTATVPQPAPIPSLPAEESKQRGAAMDFLMADRGYSQEEQLLNKQDQLEKTKTSIIDESLSRFFMGNVPDIESHAFAADPKRHAEKVLAAATPTPANNQSVVVQSQSVAQSGKKSGEPEPVVVKTRTLFKSLEVYRDLLQTPLTANASVFSASLRSYQACDFLIADITEACRTDSREVSQALSLLRQGYRQVFADQKAGEYLQAAEIGRLRQELYSTKLKAEEMRRHSVQLIYDLDAQRKADVVKLHESIQEVEQQRHNEVKQAMAKSKEYGDQVRTLRAIVDTIKQDQQVQKMDQLKKQLSEQEALIEAMKQNQILMQKQNDQLQLEFTEFKLNNSDNIDRVSALAAQIKSLESQKDFCRSCEQKIYDRAQAMTSDINEKLIRMEQVGANVRIFDKQVVDEQTESLLNQFVKQTQISDIDNRVFSLDFDKISKEILVLETKLQRLPILQKLVDDVERKDAEIARLRLLEKDLLALRKVYKNVISKQTDGMAGEGPEAANVGGSGGKDGVATATYQLVNENKLTLLRNQPLFMLIPKTFPIKILPLFSEGKVTTQLVQSILSNNMNTTVEYVQTVIHMFLTQLTMIGLQEPNSFTHHMSSKLRPSTGGQLFPFVEPIQTIFVGWVTQQYAFLENEMKKSEGEMVVNKVAFVLNLANSDQDDSGKVEDDTMLLALANLLLNSPMNPDEAQFLFFVYNLSYGGSRIMLKKQTPNNKVQQVDYSFPPEAINQYSLPTLPVFAQPPNGYISLRRAIAIATLVLNKAVQKGYFDKFVLQGKATDMIKDIDIADKGKYHLIDIIEDVMNQSLGANEQNTFMQDIIVRQQELQPSSQKMTIIQIPFFVITLLKAYKAEVLVRLESLRIMYAASLIETAQKQQNVTAAQRYRIVTDIFTIINPLAPKPQIDSAYLDTVWRSPSALWAVMIDACRVRGVLATGLQLPPMDCVMQVIGGYNQQLKRYDMDGLFTQLVTFLRSLKPLCSYLQLFNIQEFQTFILQVQTISNSNITRQNVQPLINMLKTMLVSLIGTMFSVIQATGDDFSGLPLTESFIAQNGIQLIGRKRLPCEVMLDSLPLLAGIVKTIAGFALEDKVDAAKSPKKKGKGK